MYNLKGVSVFQKQTARRGKHFSHCQEHSKKIMTAFTDVSTTKYTK
jgi:hypothetical protein